MAILRGSAGKEVYFGSEKNKARFRSRRTPRGAASVQLEALCMAAKTIFTAANMPGTFAHPRKTSEGSKVLPRRFPRCVFHPPLACACKTIRLVSAPCHLRALLQHSGNFTTFSVQISGVAAWRIQVGYIGLYISKLLLLRLLPPSMAAGSKL